MVTTDKDDAPSKMLRNNLNKEPDLPWEIHRPVPVQLQEND